MRKLFLIAAASLALTACQTTAPSVGVDTGIAPLANTSVDNKGIVYALESADTIATLVDIARDSGKLVPGTPRAKQVAGWLRDLATALRAASAAQKIGDTGRVDLSLGQATALVVAIKNAVK